MEYYDDYENREMEKGNNNFERKQKPQPNNMAVISMILGILSLLCLCMCIAFPVSILMGAAAICLSIMSRKGGPFCGFAITGLVLGILAIIFGVLEFFYLMFLSQLLNDPSFSQMMDQMMEQLNTMYD